MAEEGACKKTRSEGMSSSTGDSNLDRISELYEPLLHHIMSLLPTKDAIRSSVLSKKWKSTCDSFPFVEFDQCFFENIAPNHSEQLKMFLDYINDYVQHRERQTGVQRFRLRVCGLNRVSDSRIEEVISYFTGCGVKEIDLNILLSDRRYYNFPKCIFSSKATTILKLNGCKLQFQKLLSTCTGIKDLTVINCMYKDTEIFSSELEKLEMELGREIVSFGINAINLQSFQCNAKPWHGTINFHHCKLLKILSLNGMKIACGWLEEHLSNFVILEDLTLYGCYMPEKFLISNRKLRKLQLCNCLIKEVGIDTPELISFTYQGNIISFNLFNTPGWLCATLSLSRSLKDARWFTNLRTFLGLFDHCRVLKLIFSSYLDIIFPENIRTLLLPPLHDMKNMNIEVYSLPENYVEVLDNVLWLSPHLATLSISENKGRSIKFEFEREGLDEDIFCCMEHPSQCWQHYLRTVSIKNYNWPADGEGNIRLLEFFSENAIAIEAIYDNSDTYKVEKGKFFKQIKSS